MRLLVLVLVLVVFVAIVKLLPWWITVGLVVVAIVARERIFRAVVGGAVKGLFETKSKVLRGTQVKLHGVAPAEAPEGVEDAAGRRWFEVDVTFEVPGPSRGRQMTFWDPFEVELADVSAPPRGLDEEDEHDGTDDLALVHDVKLWADGALHEIEDKLQGSARLRLLVGVKPPLAKAKFRYYFEDFGTVEFPG